jgi:ABC-type antimicrobial peptide transport system permease subunit
MALAGVGLAIGVVAAGLVARVLTAMLYGVNPTDPVTYAAVIVVLGSIAALATWIPARRATIVDPALALRGE